MIFCKISKGLWPNVQKGGREVKGVLNNVKKNYRSGKEVHPLLYLIIHVFPSAPHCWHLHTYFWCALQHVVRPLKQFVPLAFRRAKWKTNGIHIVTQVGGAAPNPELINLETRSKVPLLSLARWTSESQGSLWIFPWLEMWKYFFKNQTVWIFLLLTQSRQTACPQFWLVHVTPVHGQPRQGRPDNLLIKT